LINCNFIFFLRDLNDGDKNKSKALIINDTDDILLNSLETERCVSKFFSKYLDNNDDEFLKKSQLAKHDKEEKSSISNLITIKAATRHIDEQQVRKATTRQQSQSMIDLHSLRSSPPPCIVVDQECEKDNVESFAHKSPNVKTVGIRSIIESQFVSFHQEPNKQQDPKKKKKRQHKSRGILENDKKSVEQDLETNSAQCNLTHTSNKNESNLNGDGPSVERKSQFSCLPTRPVYRSSLRSNSSSSNSLKSLTFQAPDCPVDRLQFFRSFSQLLRKGKRDMNNSFMSSKDTNMGGFIELVYMQELRDLIWLELKAWFDNRSMIDEDSHLCLQRRKIPHTLHKILKFSVNVQRSGGNSLYNIIQQFSEESPLSTQAQADIKRQSNESAESKCDSSAEINDLRAFIDQDKLTASVAAKLNISENTSASDISVSLNEISFSPSPEEENCYCSETLSRLCHPCVDKETNALEQVTKVLEELYEVEHLYPCTKTLAYDYPVYASDQFIARVKSMHLFVNITRDALQKIDLLAKLFHITNREAAGWPKFKGGKDFGEVIESCEVTPEAKPCDISGYSYKLSAQAPINLKVQSHLTSDHVNISNDSDLTITDFNSHESHSSVNLPADSPCSTSNYCTSNQSSNSSLNLNVKPNLLFIGKSPPSIYRRYVDKALKNKGLRYIYYQLAHILRPLLYRMHAALKKPSSHSYVEAVTNNSKYNISNDHQLTTKKLSSNSSEYRNELSQYGVWSQAYQQMSLPTFHRPFLFLLRITVDVVHECLRLRLEQQPDKPSSVSVGQLLKECKEVLQAAVQIRQSYVNLAQTVLGEGGSDVIEAQLDSYNDDLKTMLQIYLKYLEQVIQCMSKVFAESCSTLRQKGYLEKEWIFVRTFCPHIPGGEALAAKKFCHMASDLLTSIGDYIQNSVVECFEIFNESVASAESKSMSRFRRGAFESLRKCKRVFQEAGARVCQAAAFAKALRKDLEIAAEFKLLVDTNIFLQKLRETGHIRVIAPNNPNHLMFVPNYMQGNEGCIWQLVGMTCDGRGLDDSDCDSYGYLVVMVVSEKEIDWKGTIVVLEPTAEANVSLSNIQVEGVLFVVNNPSQLTFQYRQFESSMAGIIRIDKQQTSCNNLTALALSHLKQKALEMQSKTSYSLNLIQEQFDIDRVKDLEEAEKMLLKIRCLDVLHQGFKFGFEYEKALARLITGDAKDLLAKQLIDFGLQWIRFIIKKCEKGRGLRTRWITPGLQYLLIALEPQYLQVLNDDEFNLLKEEVEKVFKHLTGSNESSPQFLILPIPKPSINLQGSVLAVSNTKPLASSLNFQRSQSVVNVKGIFGDKALALLEKEETNKTTKGTRLEEWAQRKSTKGAGNLMKPQRGKILEENNSSPSEKKSFDKINKAIEKLEESRNNRLKDDGVIGCVIDLVITRAPLHITARRVNFPWQRGFKIGKILIQG